MRARYSIRVIQGNNVNHQVPVVVVASNATEACRKAIALTSVHSPRTRIDRVEEVVE